VVEGHHVKIIKRFGETSWMNISRPVQHIGDPRTPRMRGNSIRGNVPDEHFEASTAHWGPQKPKNARETRFGETSRMNISRPALGECEDTSTRARAIFSGAILCTMKPWDYGYYIWVVRFIKGSLCCLSLRTAITRKCKRRMSLKHAKHQHRQQVLGCCQNAEEARPICKPTHQIIKNPSEWHLP
jgi:hypothetical protein